MDLMDWKNIEQGAEDQVRNGETGIVIGNIMLKEAKRQIKKLGGKTNEETRSETTKKD